MDQKTVSDRITPLQQSLPPQAPPENPIQVKADESNSLEKEIQETQEKISNLKEKLNSLLIKQKNVLSSIINMIALENQGLSQQLQQQKK